MKHIPQLDGIRGIAILLVLLFHYFALVLTVDVVDKTTVFYQLFLNFKTGVDLFFVLSGFLLGSILLSNVSSNNYFKTFYTRRIVRIFPLYYLMVFIFIICLVMDLQAKLPALFADPLPLFSYLTFTQNFMMGKLGTMGAEFLRVSWSLAVEEQFYLVIPFLIRKLDKGKLVSVAILLILATIFSRVLIPGREGLWSFTLITSRIDALMLGVLLALAWQSETIKERLKANKLGIYCIFFMLMTGVVLNSAGFGFGVMRDTWYALFYVSFLLICLVDVTGIPGRLTRSRILSELGKISYAVYLFHQIVNILVHHFAFGSYPRISNLSELFVTLLSIVITVLLAYVSYFLYESRFINLGKRVKY